MSKITYDNFSDNLKEYLNRLLNSSERIEQMGEITDLNTTNKATLVSAINELVQICNGILAGDGEEEEVKATSDSFSIVDVNTEGVTSDGGILPYDAWASHGKCFVFNRANVPGDTTNKNLYTAEFSEVKFGSYALCVRLNTNGSGNTSDIVKITILNGDDEITSKSIPGTDFADNSNYFNFYLAFDYNAKGSNEEKTNLKVKIESLPVEDVQLCFDYAYIGMIIPSVFL